jgi:hypothetical protein
MSDDVPIIFAVEGATGPAGARIVFLSAVNGAQMQQYAVAGWTVFAAEGFQSPAPIDLAAVPARTCGEADIAGATVVSLECTIWSDVIARKVAAWRPSCVKVNAAFQSITDTQGEAVAATLAAMGYTLLGAQWQDDNFYRLRGIARMEPWAVLGPRDWPRINIIAVQDAAFAKTIAILGRLYAAEERRLTELRVSHALRGGHIGRLEEALMVHQRRK